MFFSHEVIVQSVTDREDGYVEIEWKRPHADVSTSSYWCGSKPKDFFRTEDWDTRLMLGALLRIWCFAATQVMGIEMMIDGEWKPMWVKGNDFEPATHSKEGRG